MNILDGKKISSDIKSEIKNYVLKKTKKGLRPPHLAAILVGHDGASLTYINSKIKSCDEVGYKSSLFHYDIKISEQELLKKNLEKVNFDGTTIRKRSNSFPVHQTCDLYLKIMNMKKKK